MLTDTKTSVHDKHRIQKEDLTVDTLHKQAMQESETAEARNSMLQM